MTKTVWQVYKAAVAEDADIYHFHDPELIPVGIMLKLKGKKVIYDVHEDVPKQILTKYWIPSFLRRTVSAGASLFEKIGSKFFDGIVAATPTIADKFPLDKTAAVQNFPMLNELVTPDATPYPDRPNDIVYVGGIAALRGIREMVQAVELLPETLKARLCLAGAFIPAELYDEICAMPGWEGLSFWDGRVESRLRRFWVEFVLGLFYSIPLQTIVMRSQINYLNICLPVFPS